MATDNILYACMYFRFYFIVRSLILMTPSSKDLFSNRMCHEAGFHANFFFKVRAALAKFEFWAVLVLAILTATFFSMTVRVFERPYACQIEPFILDYDTVGGAAWLIISSMTGLGVAPPYPCTLVGRTIVLFCNLLGTFVFVLVIDMVSKSLNMQSHKKEALVRITKNKWAVKVVRCCLQYNRMKKLFDRREGEAATKE